MFKVFLKFGPGEADFNNNSSNHNNNNTINNTRNIFIKKIREDEHKYLNLLKYWKLIKKIDFTRTHLTLIWVDLGLGRSNRK